MERWSTKMMLCIVKWMFDPMGLWIMLPSEGYSLATVLVLEETEDVWMCSSNDPTHMDYSPHSSSKPEVLVVKLVMLPNLCYMSSITVPPLKHMIQCAVWNRPSWHPSSPVPFVKGKRQLEIQGFTILIQATQREAQWLISYDPLKGLLFLILLGVGRGLYPKIYHTTETIYHTINIFIYIYIFKYINHIPHNMWYMVDIKHIPYHPLFQGNIFLWEVISRNPSSYKPHTTIGPRSCLGCCAWICPKPQQNGNGSSWHWNSWILQLRFN